MCLTVAPQTQWTSLTLASSSLETSYPKEQKYLQFPGDTVQCAVSTSLHELFSRLHICLALPSGLISAV